VVDFCAGAGGKTLALAAQMQNKGVLHACDVHTKRLDNLAKRKKRAGAHNIQTHVLSSERDKWVKHNVGKMDVVLLDAPCTGTGTWRRSPDARWNLEPENLVALQTLQSNILDSASRLVKQGGRLIYATCSMLREENEERVADFLQKNHDFEKGELSNIELFAGLNVVENYQLRTSPAKSGMDGFFVAVLQRKVKES
jgi:16S rRNA (cytosine967-C5)-methyltransferase